MRLILKKNRPAAATDLQQDCHCNRVARRNPVKLTLEPMRTSGPAAARILAAASLGTMLTFAVGCTSTIGGPGESGANGAAPPGQTGGSSGSPAGSGGAQGGGNQ